LSGLRAHYLDWPHEVSIETFSKCNASCGFCPYTTLERIGTKMPDEMIDRIIEELKDHPLPFIISPFKVNEPFLDKRLVPICRKINVELPKARLRLFSNGSALTQNHIEEVASLDRVVHLWISLNEHEAGPYQKTMGLEFERTAANLDMLHTYKEADELPHDVVISKVMGGVRPTVRDHEFVKYVDGRWPLFSWHLIKRDSWLGYVEPNDAPVPDAPCGRWYELSICADGKVSLCCMDGKAGFSLGDLNYQSLFEVYNHPAYRQRRVRNMSRKNVTPCASCNY
jgi:MoaA/NifB/PqqE/SkfB family radical SAM enzyme